MTTMLSPAEQAMLEKLLKNQMSGGVAAPQADSLLGQYQSSQRPAFTFLTPDNPPSVRSIVSQQEQARLNSPPPRFDVAGNQAAVNARLPQAQRDIREHRRVGETDDAYVTRLQAQGVPSIFIGDAVANDPFKAAKTVPQDSPSLAPDRAAARTKFLQDTYGVSSLPELFAKRRAATTGASSIISTATPYGGATSQNPFVDPRSMVQRPNGSLGQPTQAQATDAASTPVRVSFDSATASDPGFVGAAELANSPDGQVYQTQDGVYFRNDSKAQAQTPVIWDAGSRRWQPRDTMLKSLAKSDVRLRKELSRLDDEKAKIIGSDMFTADQKRELLSRNNSARNELARGMAGPPDQPKPQTIEDVGGFQLPDGAGWLIPKGNGDFMHVPGPKAEKAQDQNEDVMKFLKLRKQAADYLNTLHKGEEIPTAVTEEDIDRVLKEHGDGQMGPPNSGGKITVSNGDETFEIDESDLADAEKDGFKAVK